MCFVPQGSGNLRLAVQLPEGEDLNEWLAVHGACLRYILCPLSQRRLTGWRRSRAAVDFFNHLNMLYGTVTEFCTPQEASVSSFVPSPRGRALRPQILPCVVPDHVCRTQVSAARLP